MAANTSGCGAVGLRRMAASGKCGALLGFNEESGCADGLIGEQRRTQRAFLRSRGRGRSPLRSGDNSLDPCRYPQLNRVYLGKIKTSAGLTTAWCGLTLGACRAFCARKGVIAWIPSLLVAFLIHCNHPAARLCL